MRAIGATVAGRRHVERGVPCEDAVAIVQTADRAWTAAVLCDGCGSARHAADGARFISTELAAELLGLSARLARQGPGEWVIDAVVGAIAALREKMRARFGDRLDDHAATIVATLVSRRGGFLLHVGDGIATAIGASGADARTLRVVAQSVPKNGEFANQTFYPTEPDWIRNVWMTPVSGPALVVLCTDGAQELAYRGNSINPRALDHLLASVGDDEGGASARLGEALAGLETPTTSGDDLGIVMVFDDEALGAHRGAALDLPDDPKSEPGHGRTGQTHGVQRPWPPTPPITLGRLSRAALWIEALAARHRRIAARASMVVGAATAIALACLFAVFAGRHLSSMIFRAPASEQSRDAMAGPPTRKLDDAGSAKAAEADKAGADKAGAEKAGAEKAGADDTTARKDDQ
jgi:hypothetical protein